MISSPRRVLAVAIPVLALAALAGCATATEEPAAQTTGTPPAFDAGDGGLGGGISGEIVLVSDDTVQVQDAETQTAVTWDDATTFSVEVDGALTDVTTGVCISSTGEDVATSVRISQPVDGECTGGFGGLGGEIPEGFTPPGDGEMPEGFTPPATDGEAPEGGMPGGFGGGTNGVVTAVDGSTITVETTGLDGATSTATVTVDDATTYSTTVDGDASAIEVGKCVVALGESDGSGGYAASSMTISTAGDEGCSTGFSALGGQRPESDG